MRRQGLLLVGSMIPLLVTLGSRALVWWSFEVVFCVSAVLFAVESRR